jgi:hypothetical protein
MLSLIILGKKSIKDANMDTYMAPLIEELQEQYNCFHMDIQGRSHHEMNGVLEKSEHFMQKWCIALNNKIGRRNGR